MSVKSRLLEFLEQNRGEILSGESLAGELGCTRAAIWKAVKSLREEGYQIEAGPNKGYRLTKENNRLSIEGIRLFLLKPEAYGQVYDSVDSTNLTARKAILEGAAGHGSYIVAREQSKGRGRRGRVFYSPDSSGLYLSVILEPGGTLESSLLLTTVAATAVYRSVKKICGIDLDIKWVNDLFYNGKKVCGILSEAITDFETGDIRYLVVGIGLNLFWPQDGFPEELREIAGALYTREDDVGEIDFNQLTAEIINELLRGVENPGISADYIERNIIPGHDILIQDGKQERNAYAIGIDPDGRLRIREEDGTEKALSFGEISVRIDQ